MNEFILGSPLAAIEPPLSWWGLTLAAALLIIRADAVIAFFSGHLLALTRVLLQVFGAIVLAALFGPVWWHMWAYEGWSGVPGWLSEFYLSFATGPNWTVQSEMVITLVGAFSLIILTINFALMLWKLSTSDRVSDTLRELLG